LFYFGKILEKIQFRLLVIGYNRNWLFIGSDQYKHSKFQVKSTFGDILVKAAFFPGKSNFQEKAE
jgi:hypothetical protein